MTMFSVKLTAAQAMVRYMMSQKVRIDGKAVPLFAGVWAIFGHGNVAGLGEALHGVRDELPTYRGHNEQSMAHAAIAYAKSLNRKRVMAVTSSIGPGATNMVTAAALAHANRLPVLLVPGDVFANRRPDPVLQQIEDFGDPTVTANDAFRPVSKYWDRITRPEQLLVTLPRAMSVLTDAGECGPVTLAFCQDVQAEAYDYPEAFFAEVIWEQRRVRPDLSELARAATLLSKAKKPLIVAGGGVMYSGAAQILAKFADDRGIPVCETQAGKGTLAWNHPRNMGSVGVTGSSAANALAQEADVVLGVGTRLQDFTSGSRALFSNPDRKLIQLNITVFDGHKHLAAPIVSDALEGLKALDLSLGNYTTPGDWQDNASHLIYDWNQTAGAVMEASNAVLPSDAQVIGAVHDALDDDAIVVCAAGGLPGELHKLWRTSQPGGYHVEYGYSCMGYEIAGGLGVKMAQPDRDVVVMVGDGSYMMMNSELATSVMLGVKIIVVILDNRGFGCITRLQMGFGGERFNNLLDDAYHAVPSAIDFRKHAESQGAVSEKVGSLDEMQAAMARAKASDISYAIVIDTDPLISIEAGGAWWDVAVPEVSDRAEINEARTAYDQAVTKQRLAD
jgi:3D-(3,5/4)-trihydroxycyclohexane-1,2-dione acylhydrolase (decyclizing)